MQVYHTSSQTHARTRPATWVPRRVYYVLAYLKRQLTPGTPKAISNKHIQEAIGFGSEGEVSQIMRWLGGELPTSGRWAYGILRETEQRYRFIERERMPSGGYTITLLPTPRPIDAPEAVQLSFLDDPSMIPLAGQQDAAQRGSFSHDPPRQPDRRHSSAANARSERDHPKDMLEESSSSSMGAARKKNEWAGVTISGLGFLPIAALSKAGVTPQMLQTADLKIQTRREYDRAQQVRILIRSLLTNQPIYSAAEIAARELEQHHERPRSAAPARRSTPNQSKRLGTLNPPTSITPEQARALPRRSSARLRALLEQRERQVGSGHGTE